MQNLNELFNVELSDGILTVTLKEEKSVTEVNFKIPTPKIRENFYYTFPETECIHSSHIGSWKLSLDQKNKFLLLNFKKLEV